MRPRLARRYNNVSWYLDNLNVMWDAVYQNEPCADVEDDLCPKILSGHGEMWSETVDGSDLEPTVWPRLAAIAEKLWTPRNATVDVDAAEPRISLFRCRLLERGVAAAPLRNWLARQPPTGPGSCLEQRRRTQLAKRLALRLGRTQREVHVSLAVRLRVAAPRRAALGGP